LTQTYDDGGKLVTRFTYVPDTNEIFHQQEAHAVRIIGGIDSNLRPLSATELAGRTKPPQTINLVRSTHMYRRGEVLGGQPLTPDHIAADPYLEGDANRFIPAG